MTITAQLMDEEYEAGLLEEDTLEVQTEGSYGEGGTSDHSKLKNRDAADQHPISAITGLNEALVDKLGASELEDAIDTALAEANIITFYNVSLAVTRGIGTYTNSNIKTSSRCFCQRRVGSFMSGIQMVAGTTSQNGYVTVAFDTNFDSTVNINLIVINS